MKIPELANLINEFVSNEELTEREKKSRIANIKRQYQMTIQDFKKRDIHISLHDLRQLFRPLLENYENIKDYSSINEVLQLMAEEIRVSKITTKKDQENMENEIAGIYASILGNPGSSTKGMSSEYISKIIAKKVANADGINREDIMNLLAMQSKNMYLDIEQYQKLIDDSVITFLTSNPNGDKFTNPKIFEVFESLAASYKVQGNYDKVKEIYEMALKIKYLENTIEYQEIKNNYEKFLDYMEMKRNFEDKRFDSFDDLMNSLTTKFTTDRIFITGNGNVPSQNPNPPTPPHSNYVMPVKKKLEGFKRLVNSLKRDNEDYDIVECEIGKESYDGYVIFKIENANVSILENFNEVNARIFVVKNEMIDQVKQLARNDAVALDGVEAANHVENFDNYCRNLITKTKKLIRETQVGIAPPADDEIVFDDDILDVLSDGLKPQVQPANESIDDKDTRISGENEEIEKNITSLDKVEMERRKAHENREYVHQLEAEIERIQNDAAEKIAKIKQEIAGIQGTDEH